MSKFTYLITDPKLIDDRKQVLVNVGRDFEESRFCFAPMTSNIGRDGKKYINTRWLYKNPQTEKYEKPLFILPTNMGFGISPVYNFKEKDVHEGYQVSYSYTSPKTVEKPTPEEEKALEFVNAFYRRNVELMEFECTRKDLKELILPKTITSMYLCSKDEPEWFLELIKPLIEKPKMQDDNKKPIKGTVDNSKPYRSYFKFEGKGKVMKTIVEFVENRKLLMISDPVKLYDCKDDDRYPDLSKDMRGNQTIVVSPNTIWGIFGDSPFVSRPKLSVYQYRFEKVEFSNTRNSVLPMDCFDEDPEIDDGTTSAPEGSPQKPQFSMNLTEDNENDSSLPGEDQPLQDGGLSQLEKIKEATKKRSSKSKK